MSAYSTVCMTRDDAVAVVQALVPLVGESALSRVVDSLIDTHAWFARVCSKPVPHYCKRRDKILRKFNKALARGSVTDDKLGYVVDTLICKACLYNVAVYKPEWKCNLESDHARFTSAESMLRYVDPQEC